jgi:hypothetical protein
MPARRGPAPNSRPSTETITTADNHIDQGDSTAWLRPAEDAEVARRHPSLLDAGGNVSTDRSDYGGVTLRPGRRHA